MKRELADLLLHAFYLDVFASSVGCVHGVRLGLTSLTTASHWRARRRNRWRSTGENIHCHT